MRNRENKERNNGKQNMQIVSKTKRIILGMKEYAHHSNRGVK
jgi:hypothetical protein